MKSVFIPKIYVCTWYLCWCILKTEACAHFSSWKNIFFILFCVLVSQLFILELYSFSKDLCMVVCWVCAAWFFLRLANPNFSALPSVQQQCGQDWECIPVPQLPLVNQQAWQNYLDEILLHISLVWVYLHKSLHDHKSPSYIVEQRSSLLMLCMLYIGVESCISCMLRHK